MKKTNKTNVITCLLMALIMIAGYLFPIQVVPMKAVAEQKAEVAETDAQEVGRDAAEAVTTAATIEPKSRSTTTAPATTTTTTATKKKVVVKKSVPTEALDALISNFINSNEIEGTTTTTITTEKASPKKMTTTTTTTTTAKSSNQSTEKANTAKTTTAAGTEGSEIKDSYRDIIFRKVLVKPEEEFENEIVLNDQPQWMLVVEFRVEKDGAYWPVYTISEKDYFNPLDPRYARENWYFGKTRYVTIGGVNYSTAAVIKTIKEKYLVNEDKIRDYEIYTLESHVPEAEPADTAEPEESQELAEDEEFVEEE